MTFSVTVGPTSNTSVSGSTYSVTLTGCTAGHAIVIGVWFYDASKTISVVSVSGESNATAIGTLDRDSAQFDAAKQMFYLPVLTGTANKSISAFLSGTPTFAGGIWAAEVSAAIALDTNAAAHGNVAPGTGEYSVNYTTSAANDIVFSFDEASNDTTPPSGWTGFALGNTGNFLDGQYIADIGAAGSKTPIYVNVAGNGAYQLVVAAFKAAAASGTLSKVNTIAVANVSNLNNIAYASIKAANGLTTGN